MSTAELEALAARNASEPQAVYGVFDADRVPALDIRSFKVVKGISVAVSPDCSYRLVRDAILDAEETLDLYIYNVSAEHLLDLLRDRKEKGVKVRVMYDMMDTRGGERDKLLGLGVELKVAPSWGRRQVFTVCHQKFAVIDGRALLLGSANWAGTSIPKAEVPGRFKKGNREWVVHIVDRKVAGWFAKVFKADWDIPEMEGPQGAFEPPNIPELPGLAAPAPAVTVPDEVFDVESPDLGGGAKVTPIMSPDNYFELVRDLIRNARSSIDIEQQYIKVGGKRTKEVLQELAARKNEVEIRIIVSAAYEEGWKESVDSIRAAGLYNRLRALSLDSFTHLHNKGVLVDGKYTVITSTNMSENSITQAREAGVLIESEAVGDYYRRAVDVDWASGIAPSDVKHHLASVEDDAGEPVEVETVEVHPADLRVV